MRTSVIKYRVADFLKRYPPFNEMSDLDLLDLAASGRVVFHESDEYVFQKEDSRGPFIWVVQQGMVHLLDGSQENQQLRDILGEGDMLGLGRFLGNTSYRYSARTASDVILYSIDAATFEAATKGNAAVSRYLAAHFSIRARYTEPSDTEPPARENPGGKVRAEKSWLDIAGPDATMLREALVTVEAQASARDAARRMKETGSSWIAVADHERVIGILGNETLRDQVASGADLTSATVRSIMTSEFPISAPKLRVSDCFLEMIRGRSTVLAITEDGSRETPLLGFLDAPRLALLTGWNPALFAREMASQRGVTDVSHLLSQGSVMVADGLADPANIDVGVRLASELLDTVVEQLIHEAQRQVAAEGKEAPEVSATWLVFGRTARRENFPFRQPEVGVVFDASSQRSSGMRAYFSEVVERVASILGAAGLPNPRRHAPWADYCRSLSDWTEYFVSRITDPIGQGIYATRDLFDFRPLRGDQSVATLLRDRVKRALESDSSFIPVLANDTMSNLPPLTFFRGVIIDLDGAKREALDIEETLLDPISDAARVFGYASKDLAVTNTLERLAHAAGLLPRAATVLLEAAEAFRVASWQLTRSRLRGLDAMRSIQPSTLSRYDQRRLKTAFSAIQNLLELTGTAFY